MAIWTSEIKELERLYESFKGQLPDLEKELGKLIKADDENMILLYSRRCLEVIITDLCECELKRPRKTEPLKGIMDKLHKEGKVPSHIMTSMQGLNELSIYGAHPKDFDPQQIKPVLNNLAIIIRWYLKYKQIVTIDKTEVDEEMIRLRKEPLEEVRIKERTEVQEKPFKAGKRKLISIVTIVVILIIATILAYPKIFKKDTLVKLRSSDEKISIAVLPFQNMTNDTTWNVWQDGIQNELINHLTNSEELKVRQTESINTLIQSKGFTNYASITPSVAGKISQKLDADIFIYGSIKQVGTILRLNAQLIDSKTHDAFKSFQIDGTAENILHLIDSLSVMVKNFLIISKLKKAEFSDIQNIVSTNSPEAYRYFISGQNALKEQDYRTAIKMYLQAIAIDSNLTVAHILLSLANLNLGLDQEARKWCLKAYKKKDLMPIQQKLLTNWAYALYFETPYEQIKYLKQSLEIDEQSPLNFWQLGDAYSQLYQFDEAIADYKQALDIYNKWDTKPMWVLNYTNLGNAYHMTGQYREERKLYKKAEHDFPDDPRLIFRQATLSLTEGDTVTANEYIKTYISLSKERSSSDAIISTSLAIMYERAGILNKAEEYYRKALSLEPANPARMNDLAWFLIDKDRNVVEGLKLDDKAIELSPDTWYMLDTKGWGLYKQGKYQEALQLIEKAWNLKPYYYHELFLHLEAAKKAVANQKDN